MSPGTELSDQGRKYVKLLMTMEEDVRDEFELSRDGVAAASLVEAVVTCAAWVQGRFPEAARWAACASSIVFPAIFPPERMQ